MNEKGFKNAVVAAVRKRYPSVWAYCPADLNTGGEPDIRFKYVPEIGKTDPPCPECGFWPSPRFIWLELKVQPYKPTELQKRVLRKLHFPPTSSAFVAEKRKGASSILISTVNCVGDLHNVRLVDSIPEMLRVIFGEEEEE